MNGGARFIVMVALFLSGCAMHDAHVAQDKVMLRLRAPDARQVFLVCSLDGYQPRPTVKRGGRWVGTLPATRGFRYFYLVDGEVLVPDCAMRENDDFGSQSCIFEPSL